MANQNLGDAKKAKNDEFYTQFNDIEKEMPSAIINYGFFHLLGYMEGK